MRVHIDTNQAQSAVQAISDHASTIMDGSEALMRQTRKIGKQMQTQMADTVLKSVKEIETDLGHLRNEMYKLQGYMRELSTYIAQYSNCGYKYSVMTNHYANVTTHEVAEFRYRTQEVTEKTVTFQNVFDEECVRIRQELDSGIYKLDENHSACSQARTSLVQKIEHAQYKLQELQMKLEGLERRLRELQAQIQELRRKAQAARAAAAAVPVPPLRTWTDDDGNHHSNAAEVNAAQAKKQAYLAEAARYDAEADRLQVEANQVAQEIAAVRAEIEYVKSVLAQMQATEAELRAHLAELTRNREALSQCRTTVNKIHSFCMEQCATMRKECTEAESNLSRAAMELDGYTGTLISDPALCKWRLF